MRRALPRPVLAAVIVPLVVIVGFQSAWAAYACRTDGEVRAHCCCAKKKDAGDGAAHLVAQSCCKVIVHALPDAPAAREADRVSVSYAPVVMIVTAPPVIAPPVERVVSIPELARPPPNRTLYLDKQALLR